MNFQTYKGYSKQVKAAKEEQRLKEEAEKGKTTMFKGKKLVQPPREK